MCLIDSKRNLSSNTVFLYRYFFNLGTVCNSVHAKHHVSLKFFSHVNYKLSRNVPDVCDWLCLYTVPPPFFSHFFLHECDSFLKSSCLKDAMSIFFWGGLKMCFCVKLYNCTGIIGEFKKGNATGYVLLVHIIL